MFDIHSNITPTIIQPPQLTFTHRLFHKWLIIRKSTDHLRKNSTFITITAKDDML